MEQFHNNASLEAVDRRAPNKSKNCQRKMEGDVSARDDRHFLRMTVNGRTDFSKLLAARWSTATGVLMLASSICRRLLHRGLRARCLYTGSSHGKPTTAVSAMGS
ncbi:hypothetical protein TNCV_1541831 [Trichonephila clavipes]|nr:hypothetical protein TNCV_1541831 [Trichonephila clavipes]